MAKQKKELPEKIIENEIEEKSSTFKTRRLYTKSDTKSGRGSKFDSVYKEIIERTRDGASIKDRCGGLIVHNTYWEWLRAGDIDLAQGVESQFSNFSAKIKEAENEYRKMLRNSIKLAVPDDWKAASWLLERSDPETYKLRDKMDVKQEVEISQKAILEIPDNGRRTIAK